MRFLRTVVLLFAVVNVSLPQNTTSIEGIVVEQGTNNVLPRATLDLRAIDNTNTRYPAITTGEGKFSFRSVLPGRYSLVASRAGYVRAEHGQRGPNGAGTILEVRAGQNLRDIRMSMIPSAAISGRVYDDKGDPVVNAQIHAFRVSYAEGWRKMVPVTSVVTNDLGEYRVFGLPQGQYYVSAQPDPRSFVRSPAYASLAPPLPGMVVLTGNSGGSGGTPDPANAFLSGADYAPIFFGGSASEFSATPITVRAGDNLRGVDIPVQRVPMAQLVGTVIDGSTREPVRATLTVAPVAPNIRFAPLTTINVLGGVLSVTPRPNTVANGQFRTEFLPRGAYLITAIAEVGGRRLAGQAVADTRNPNPVAVQIAVAPALELSGQIAFEGTPPVPNLKVGLVNTAGQSLDVAAVPVSADGTFTLRGVAPGHYLVQVSPLSSTASTAFLKSARLAGSDVLSDGIGLERPPEGRLEMIVAGDPGRLSGAVGGTDRQAIAGITTVLVPEDRHRMDLYRSVVTDAAGQYRLDGVSPGRYKLFAWEDVEKNLWLDRDFMSVYEDRGVALAVDAGGTHTAILTAIPVR